MPSRHSNFETCMVIWGLEVWPSYLLVTEAPHHIDNLRMEGEELFFFFKPEHRERWTHSTRSAVTGGSVNHNTKTRVSEIATTDQEHLSRKVSSLTGDVRCESCLNRHYLVDSSGQWPEPYKFLCQENNPKCPRENYIKQQTLNNMTMVISPAVNICCYIQDVLMYMIQSSHTAKK